jgi:transposase
LQTSRKHPIELGERAVRRIPKPVIAQLARQLNVHPEASRTWRGQDEADRGEREVSPDHGGDRGEPAAAREDKELHTVNEVRKAPSAYFAQEIGPTRRRS